LRRIGLCGGIPEGLAESLIAGGPFSVPAPEGSEAFALVCRGRTFLPPISDVEMLLLALE